MFAALNSIISAFAIRVPVAFLLTSLVPHPSLFEIGIAPPCASVLTIILAFSYLEYLAKNKKLLVKQKKDEI
jgi:hypothetical protein